MAAFAQCYLTHDEAVQAIDDYGRGLLHNGENRAPNRPIQHNRLPVAQWGKSQNTHCDGSIPSGQATRYQRGNDGVGGPPGESPGKIAITPQPAVSRLPMAPPSRNCSSLPTSRWFSPLSIHLAYFRRNVSTLWPIWRAANAGVTPAIKSIVA